MQKDFNNAWTFLYLCKYGCGLVLRRSIALFRRMVFISAAPSYETPFF
jgi:hypothetical protein